MDAQNPNVLSHAQSAVAANDVHETRFQAYRHRRSHGYGVIHDNTRHTSRFTVIGNHLTQHPELSLLAIGLACHIQSLPTGAPVDIKTLAARFPEGPTRIAAALRELETHGYLRRERERTPNGRLVTRTISCNQPRAARCHTSTPPPAPTCPPAPPPAPAAVPTGGKTASPEHTPRKKPREPRKRHPLPPVPQPASPSPTLLRAAADLLAGLHREDPRLLLSACDTAHLAPGVAAWLQRDVTPTAVRHALTTDLPPEALRRPAALLAHRLTAQLPPPPPFRTPAAPPPPVRHPLQNCDGCDRAFRAPEPGLCADCRTAAAVPS
ncbi:helix-turn-helix domain-containing protein [Streptomyces thermoalcalitolerans]|uniref:Helix-turn-helix domain-containing protein n=1 Tax=Streptomyces thermoalcalitolerans TaxID=65605 RepID=A0ABN1NQJ2_9ACTN